MSENITSPVPSGSDFARGDSSTGDLAESQVGTPQAGGVSPTVPTKKSPILLFIALALLSIVSVLAIYLFLQVRTLTLEQTTPSPSPSPTSSTDPTADWQTIINTELNYTIGLPNNWKTIKPSNLNETYEIYESQTGQSIDIIKDTNPRTPCRGDCYVTEYSEQTTITGYPATKDLGYVGDVGGNIAHNFITYNVPSGNTSLSITFHPSTVGKSPGGNIIPILPQEEKLFDQILSTFKFTN